MTIEEKQQEVLNRMEKLGIESPDLDELVHQIAGRMASNVNNSGLSGQLEWILEHSDLDDIEVFIDLLIQDRGLTRNGMLDTVEE